MSFRKIHLVVAGFCMAVTVAHAEDAPKSDASTKPKDKGQPSRIISKVDVKPNTAATEAEAREVSFAAGRILKHIVQARDAIRDDKKDLASSHVEQSLKLEEIIEGVMPRYLVKTEINSGKLAYCDEEEVMPRYIMLFDELERHDIISPVAQAKLESQAQSSTNERKEPAKLETNGKPTNAVAVSHADMRHTSARLDIVLTKQLLNRAKKNLLEGKNHVADEALLAIQSRCVILEFEEIDLPLEEAADNLKLAEIEIKEGRHAEAKAALNVAIDQLKRYEQSVGENRGAEVKALHEEISKLTAELEKGSPSEADRQKHATRISDWWQRATKWFKSQSK